MLGEGASSVSTTMSSFPADQRVLVGRVAMKEFVLHEARELAELRDMRPGIHLMHGAKDPAHLSLAGNKSPEGFAVARAY
jgi:hypothetical protein